MAASLKDPGSIPGGGPKRFHDSFDSVFYIVGECISCAADTHLATDLTCKYYFIATGHFSKSHPTLLGGTYKYADFNILDIMSLFITRQHCVSFGKHPMTYMEE